MTVKVISGTLFALFVLWFTVCLLLFCLIPPAAPTSRADAVIVLGGSSKERLPVAQRFAADTGAPVLVLSWTDTPGNTYADNMCQEASFPSASLVCFRPEGMNTRSEAEVIGKLARINGWTSIAVVTSEYHAPRAGTLIQQCADVEVSMVASKPKLDSLEWLQRFVIETGGLLDVHLRPECSF